MSRRTVAVVFVVFLAVVGGGRADAETPSLSLPTLTDIIEWFAGPREPDQSPQQCSLSCQLRADQAVSQCRGNADESALARLGRAPPAADCRLKVAQSYEACMTSCGTPVPAALIDRRLASRPSDMTLERVLERMQSQRQVKP